jgi:ribosomal protein S27E
MRCPGQDTRFWQPGDIYEVKCPSCGEKLEFFKDDTRRTCKHCGQVIRNPKLDVGCAEHCPFSADCLGELVSNDNE